MTLDERIIRTLCEESGWQLSDYRRSDRYIGITVVSMVTGIHAVVGVGRPNGLALGDDVLDDLQRLLMGVPHDATA